MKNPCVDCPDREACFEDDSRPTCKAERDWYEARYGRLSIPDAETGKPRSQE